MLGEEKVFFFFLVLPLLFSLTRVLLAGGASGTATNNEGSTPLHLAAKQNHLSALQLLVGSGKVDLLAKDTEGNTPIQLCEKGSECFDFLRDKLLEMRRVRDGSSCRRCTK